MSRVWCCGGKFCGKQSPRNPDAIEIPGFLRYFPSFQNSSHKFYSIYSTFTVSYILHDHVSSLLVSLNRSLDHRDPFLLKLLSERVAHILCVRCLNTRFVQYAIKNKLNCNAAGNADENRHSAVSARQRATVRLEGGGYGFLLSRSAPLHRESD